MAMITDYSLLDEGVEITYNTTARTIALSEAGQLTSDGVDGTEVTRHAKRAWKDVAGRSAFPYPFETALGGYIWLINGWDWANDATRKLLRNIGWAVIDEASGNATQIWAGVITKGDIGASDQVYYIQYGSDTPHNFTYLGAVNEAIQVYLDSNADGTPDYDYRDQLDIFVRPWGRTFAQSGMTAENITALSNTRHIFSLANQVDEDIAASYAEMSTIEPYISMGLTYYATDQNRDTGDGASPYRRIITAPASTTLQQFYEFAQYRLTLDSDIDDGAGVVNGKTASAFCYFDGNTLRTYSGCWLESVREDERNDIVFTDQVGTTHTYPYTAAILLKFGTNAQNDPDYKYWVFFDNPDGVADNGDEYGTSGAIIVDNADGVDIAGLVSAQAEVAVSFDYDGNVQGGRIAGTDASAWLIGIGITGDFASKQFTITRSTTNQVSIDPTLNRIEV
jgi:hypothetical protein